jgi:ribonuclease HI
MPRIVVYTDGSCTKNGSRNAQASWATWFPSHPDWSDAQRVGGDIQTNNRGELSAILEAFRRVTRELGTACEAIDIVVYTDSEYSKNCLTIWTAGWIRKNWVTSGGTPVLNRDLIEEVLSLRPKFKSTVFQYVRAHTGGSDEHSVHNDRVDRMARRVLDDSVVLPALHTETSGCPLQLMGPAVQTGVLSAWVKENMSFLDTSALEKALLRALSDTFANHGHKMEIRKGMATLTAGLKVESGSIDTND